ncbi:MAG: TerC family protein [Paludibacterium sp.]|uniref:TerC family protein n=1 Tax=Paludibacterium sp. TaxID=1917523 RepID=UPI0025DDC0EB|nr:TerC family protein [Paludibacterium sp.]MBV8047812.1 TerC family protein [Paludibacterium sp.]
MQTVGTWWMWVGFTVFVVAMLLVDLLAMRGGKAHRVSFKEAAGWSAVWVAVSLAFAALLWWRLDVTLGREAANTQALAFVTGYLIEKALAVDNVFVWLMLFGAFAIPPELQKRVLALGVFGAIVLRAGMIFGGVWLVHQFHWLLYVFGAFLLYTGVHMWRGADAPAGTPGGALLGWLRRHVNVTDRLHGERFFVTQETDGKTARFVTPLLLVLVLVEISDLIFAVDSIPAIFAVSLDPFIVLTSNVFAILGLRAMYFLLADMAARFSLLKYGLAIVLVFVGAKMLLMDLIHVPVLFALGVVAAIIATSVVLSLRRTPPEHGG